MQKLSVVIDVSKSIDRIISLLFLMSAYKDDINIILTESNDEIIEYVKSICVLYKRDNVDIFYLNKNDNLSPICPLTANIIGSFNGKISSQFNENVFSKTILCFENINFLVPYIDYLNKNKIEVIYGSQLPFIKKVKQISKIPLSIYNIDQPNNEINLNDFNNLVVIPNNVSMQLRHKKGLSVSLIEPKNTTGNILFNLLERLDLSDNYPNLFYLSLPLFVIFSDNFDLSDVSYIRSNSAYYEKETQPIIHMVSHIHKIETMLSLVFETFIEHKKHNSNVISLNIPNRYNFNLFSFVNNTNFIVKEIGWEKRLPSSSFGPVRRNYYILHFVVSGKGIYKVNNLVYELSKGDVFVVPPGVITYYQADELDPCEYYWVAFSAPENSSILKEIKIITRKTLVIRPAMFNSIINKIKYLIDLGISTPNLELICQGYVYLMFANLISNKNDVKLNEDIALKAKEYMDKNFETPITVEDVKNYVNYDRTYLFRKFKTKYNISPKEYLLNLRMEKASKLLKQNIPIQNVVTSCGFSDYQTFFVLFKKRFNLTPSQYKKQHI